MYTCLRRTALSWLIGYCSLALPLLASAQNNEVGWVLATSMDGDLFPSYVLAHAQWEVPQSHKVTVDKDVYTVIYEDGVGQLAITLEMTEAADVKIEVLKSKINEYSVYQDKLAAGRYLIHPKIAYDFDALRAQRQPTPISLSFVLYVNGEKLEQKPLTVNLRSISECPFYQVYDEGEQVEDMKYMFAAYVNEDSPQVDNLLKDALKTRIATSFIGYQGDEQAVVNQAGAIWAAMAHRGIKYSSITNSSNASKTIYSQRVRAFEDVLSSDQANCVDGSVFFASALKAVNIAPFLVLVPGHCYIGFYLDKEKTQPYVLETTMLGQADGSRYPIGSQEANQLALRVFAAAAKTAAANYSKHLAKFGKDDGQYQLIDIIEAREAGIKPIGR